MPRKVTFHKLSINFLLNFSGMVLIPFFLFGVFINYYYARLLIDNTLEKMTETADQIAENIDQEIRNISILSSSLIHNKEFQKACRDYTEGEDAGDYIQFHTDLDLHINNLFSYTNTLGSVNVFVDGRKSYEFLNHPSRSIPVESDYYANLLKQREESNRNVISIENDLFAVTDNRNTNRYPIMTLAVFPRENSYGDSIPVILFRYQLKFLKELERLPADERGIIIIDKDRNILLTNLEDRETVEVLNPERSRSWIKAEGDISITEWTVIQASPRGQMLRPIHKLRMIFFLVMAGILFIFILYTILFFNRLINPINNLADTMNRVKSGEKAVQTDLHGPFEMQHLQSTFNRMILQTERLTEEQRKIEEEKSHLELQALQYQINPHFIANTLNSIRLMAVVNKDEHIKNMTASLMRLVNDSFRAEGSNITLAEEKESLLSYVHIMKVRFGNRIELRFPLEGELVKYKIRKMLLQPLVENSIIHGFSGRMERGIISIQTEVKDDALYIRVTDNGSGLEAEQDESSVKGLTSLGLESVNRRIHLNYGETYGLTIRSRKNRYTSVTLKLPIKIGETVL